MKRILSFLGVRKMDTKSVSLLGLFVALTVVFTIWFTLRIGNQLEISLKFIPVFVMGALFGPLFAGLTSLLGDIISIIVYPVGAPIIGMFATEFLSGFFYGTFFYKKYDRSFSFFIRVALCVIIQFILSLVLNSYFLVQAGYFSSMKAAITIRFFASFIKMLVQAVVIIFAPAYLKIFSKLIK